MVAMALPVGTVTFLFTDIEGSTRLWERDPAEMQQALARHDALLRDVIEGHGGAIFKTVGDAFCAVFAAPQPAIEAAIAGQRVLQRELPWIGVRMAIHTGTAEHRGGDYFGSALNRVARLLAAGHGRQTLLSRATAEQVRGGMPTDTTLRLLGRHQLRDIVEWETIFDLEPPDLPAKFPPLNTLDVAFRRGVMRALVAMGVVVAIVASLALLAWRNANAEATQRRRANLALTRQVAERVDGDLRGLAMVANVLAASFTRDGLAHEAELTRSLKSTIAHEPRIFGMALAFEPWRFDPTRRTTAPYVSPQPDGIRDKYLLPPTYEPIYREWEWYRCRAKRSAPPERALSRQGRRRDPDGHVLGADRRIREVRGRPDGGPLRRVLRRAPRLAEGARARRSKLRLRAQRKGRFHQPPGPRLRLREARDGGQARSPARRPEDRGPLLHGARAVDARAIGERDRDRSGDGEGGDVSLRSRALGRLVVRRRRRCGGAARFAFARSGDGSARRRPGSTSRSPKG